MNCETVFRTVKWVLGLVVILPIMLVTLPIFLITMTIIIMVETDSCEEFLFELKVYFGCIKELVVGK